MLVVKWMTMTTTPAENPEDLTDEEGIDLDVDDLDWNDLNH
jgi:hypothetical protein